MKPPINSSGLSGHLTACTKATSTGGIFVKFGVGEFYENFTTLPLAATQTMSTNMKW